MKKSKKVSKTSEADNMEMLRKLSNVSQALENLVTQCNSDEMFNYLKEFSLSALDHIRIKMMKEIHAGE